MDISKILEEPLLVDYDDSVSKVASRMLRERRHEAFVMRNGSFEGVAQASEIAKKNIQDPGNTKIGPFAKKVEWVFPETPVEDAINEILINNFKSLPVNAYKSGRMFVVTKKGLLGLIRDDPAVKNRTAGEIMFYPYCISRDDTITTAKSIIKSMEVFTIPVLDEMGRVEGIIEPLDMLRAIRGWERPESDETSGDKLSTKGVMASSLMQTDIPKVSPETQLRKLVDLLVSGKAPAVIVEKDGKLAGMVMPKDILKLFGTRKEGVYVTISGIQEEDTFMKSVVDEEIGNELRKLAKMVPIQYLAVNVKKHEKDDGKRIKYSIKARLITYKGAYFAHDFAWDITKAVRGMLQKLEKEMLKKEEKKASHSR